MATTRSNRLAKLAIKTGYRKFVLFTAITSLAAWMTFDGIMEAEQFVTLTQWTFGATAVGLSAEHFGK